MLELHQLEIGGHEIQIGEVGAPYDVRQVAAHAGVSHGAVERLVFTDVEFRLDAMQGRQARLRIEVDRQNSVSPQRQILREMGGGRRLPAAALEVDYRYDLKWFVRAATRDVAPIALAT